MQNLSQLTLRPHPDNGCEGAFIDNNSCSWSGPAEWFWSGVLDFCGCGPDEPTEKLMGLLRTLLQAYDSPTPAGWYQFHQESAYDDTLLNVFLYVLNSRGICDHGTSVSGSHLTKEGARIVRIALSAPSL